MPLNLGWENTRDGIALPNAHHRPFRCGDILISPWRLRFCTAAKPI
jgi:hypothetical protein